MTENLILIAGATGQVGASAAAYFSRLEGWKAVGLSRGPKSDGSFPLIGVDLLDRNDCREKLSHLKTVTHIIYAARYDHVGGESESADINSDMLSNLLDAVEPAAPNLRHVHLVHGTKYYGHYLGPGPVPYREDAPRRDIELFYYPQHDILMQRQQGRSWNWSISRPHTFCSLSTGEPRSITLLVAVYASILRELGLPLAFPGSSKSFVAKTQFTWLPMLSRAIAWMITEPACSNQVYNVVNGDPKSWEQLWPIFADYFDMRADGPSFESATSFASGNSRVWDRVIMKYGLRTSELQSAVQWPYGDYVMSPEWDVVSDMTKAREDGFTEKIDTVEMWLTSFDFYRKQKIIP